MDRIAKARDNELPGDLSAD